ncbi:hypothetical protein [Methylocaldum gracile]|jgi:hypothetical protein|uniref:hypothetical protein n=1 Tax=unclassified Methylocaldum TaxID=2622260 RepID=UPI00105CA0D1
MKLTPQTRYAGMPSEFRVFPSARYFEICFERLYRLIQNLMDTADRDLLLVPTHLGIDVAQCETIARPVYPCSPSKTVSSRRLYTRNIPDDLAGR